MAKVSIGSLSTFNHENQDWSVYKERLEQWFAANDLESVAEGKASIKKRAVLLSSLADSTFKLVRDLALPKKLNTLEYDALIKLLDDHFETAKCGFAERNRFYTATQRTTEELAEWAVRLRGLAVDCSFPTNHLNELLRDRFVLGMRSGPERDKLFTMDMTELTLNKALETAQAIRSAREGAAEPAPVVMPRADLPVYRTATVAAGQASAPRPTGGGPPVERARREQLPHARPCVVCGYTSHQADTCKFKRYKCGKCGERGHLRRVCSRKNVQQHFVEVEVDDVGDDDTGSAVTLISACERTAAGGTEQHERDQSSVNISGPAPSIDVVQRPEMEDTDNDLRELDVAEESESEHDETPSPPPRPRNPLRDIFIYKNYF